MYSDSCWRAYVTFNGEPLQLYYSTEEEAEEMVIFCNDLNNYRVVPWAIRKKKRESAKYKDLPIGFYESTFKKTLADGEIKRYKYIKCCFVVNGKNEAIMRSYGAKKSRENAILEVKTEVLEFLKTTTEEYHNVK